MEILSDDNASESRFPLKKPLPPIGGGGDHEEIELPNSDSETDDEQINSKDEDERSTASNGKFVGHLIMMSQYMKRNDVTM